MLHLASLMNPSGGANPTKAQYEAAIKGHATPEILNPLIPANLPNVYQPGPRTPDGGFKYEWTTPEGMWTVWGHGPETGAPAGSQAAIEWTVRVKVDNRFLTYFPLGTGLGRADLDNTTRWVNGRAAEFTHIPFAPRAGLVGRVL